MRLFLEQKAPGNSTQDQMVACVYRLPLSPKKYHRSGLGGSPPSLFLIKIPFHLSLSFCQLLSTKKTALHTSTEVLAKPLHSVALPSHLPIRHMEHKCKGFL